MSNMSSRVLLNNENELFSTRKLTLRSFSNFRSDIVTESGDFLQEITEFGVVMADLISV